MATPDGIPRVSAASMSTPAAENTRVIIQISCVAALGGFLFGFDSGVINGAIDGLKSAFQSGAVEVGFEAASLLLGCAVGAVSAGRLADYCGRRIILIVAAVLFLVSALGAGAALSAWWFITARVIGGLAVGAASIIAPAYIAEVAPARYRGRLATVQQIAIISGLFCAFLSNYLIARAAGVSTGTLWLHQAAWRWMFWVQGLPAALFVVSLLFIPESPRFLVLSRRDREAQAVLDRLYGTAQGGSKFTEISQSLARDRHRPRFSDLLVPGQRRLRPIVWVGVGLAALQQLVGINVIFYYGAVLWQAVGFSESDALLINVVSGALSVGACLIAIALIDRLGRRPLLWVGSVGMAITLVLIALAFSRAGLDVAGHVVLPHAAGIVALVAANLYVIFFNMSWGPAMWVMLGEMFPNQIRGSSLAVTGGVQWIANFVVTVSFPVLLVGIGLSWTYALYAVAAVVSIVFVTRWVPETRGAELEQMHG